MTHVTSKDGTPVAYDRQGQGPVVILVTGGLDDGAENAPLATVLAEGFTTYNYARRGRAESGDTLPYALEREIEDIAALVDEAGGQADLYGVSSGGALALEAALAGLPIGKVAVYEVPYVIDDDMRAGWQKYAVDLDVALAAGRSDTALELFMRVAGSSEQDIAGAKASHLWPGLEQIAHTLAYDARCLRDGLPPADFAAISQPTLVLTGGGADFFERAGDALTEVVPGAQRVKLTGQGHVVEAEAMGPVLTRFFKGQAEKLYSST